MQATTTRPQTRARGLTPLFQGHRARRPLPDELWTSGAFAVCLFDHRNSFTAGCAKSGRQRYRCGHKRLYRKPGFGRVGKYPGGIRQPGITKDSRAHRAGYFFNVDQLRVQLEADINSAPQLLINALILIIIFAALRGIFSFLQAYWGEKNSQAVAYDIRNELYAKIQSLSFSYHDKNQTGQLMIRATDDVEKVRLFIGQGLLQLVGAVILLTGTIIILFSTNTTLAWTAMPILPVALVIVHVLRRHQPAVVHEDTGKTFRAQYGLAGKSGGCESDQGIYAREGTTDEVPHRRR